MVGFILFVICWIIAITAQSSPCHDNQADSTYLLCKILSGNGSNLIQIIQGEATYNLLWNLTNYCTDWDETFIDCSGDDIITVLRLENTDGNEISTAFTQKLNFGVFITHIHICCK